MSRARAALRRLAHFVACVLLGLSCTGAGAQGIEVVYLAADDCRYCRHWESRAKGELLAELLTSNEGKAVRYHEIKGDTLREPIVARHYPAELKWLARRLGPSRGVPRFVLVVDGEVATSAYGTNEYATRFLPILRQAVARRSAGT